MEKEFVPYWLAVKLKELGFDGVFFGMYTEDRDFPHLVYGDLLYSKVNMYLLKEECFAPLWQQAFDFFRQKGFDGEIYPCACGYRWVISKSAINPSKNISGGTYVCDSGFNGDNDGGAWNTYEQSRLECLKKLIEIVQNDNINIQK